jgi:acetylornithine deacetylase/succinyl-diaminopimelate desuccinylase-like protein
MLTALARMARRGSRPRRTEIVFAGLIDEEHGQAGSRALARSGYGADLAVVGEPTQLRVVTAHKGGHWIRLQTHGVAAHGARPDLGRSAVLAMARIVCLLETEYREQLRERLHPLLGHPTVNVGHIEGGLQPNIVPDACSIQVDRRSLPGETLTSILQEMRALLRHHGLAARMTDLRSGPCPALETDCRLPLVRRFMAAAGQGDAAGADYFCDAAILAAGGTPSVVFGPGDIAQAHTRDEWVEVRQLDRATDILERFLRALP